MSDTPQTPEATEPTAPRNDLLDACSAALGDLLLGSDVNTGQVILHTNAANLLAVIQILRDHPQLACQQLIDITAIDYPQEDQRFVMVYNFLSVTLNHRLRVKIMTDENTPVPSVVPLYPAANWLEREVWDMFGVFFAGHPDHRRILTDYGFDGHPLRKDFPLTGYVELRYDPALQRVVYEPVSLTQDFRALDYTSPWEGMTTMQLPGDEKATIPAYGWKPEVPQVPAALSNKE